MANQINQYPIEATELIDSDLLDVDKDLGLGVYESQKVSVGTTLGDATTQASIYDSGWKAIPDYNMSYGLAPIDAVTLGANQLSIRIIGKTVFIAGLYLLPLATDATGLTLYNNWQDYDTAPRRNVPFLYLGTGGGYNKTTNGVMYTNEPVLPSPLRPDKTYSLAGGFIFTRNVKLDDASQRYALQTYIHNVYIIADGTFAIGSTEAVQGNGNSTFGEHGETQALCSRFLSTDFVPDFENSRSGFAGVASQREPVANLLTAGLDIDATKGEELGGFNIFLNSHYCLDQATDPKVIKQAFDNL